VPLQVPLLELFLLLFELRCYEWAAFGKSCSLYHLFIVHVVKIQVPETLCSAFPSPSDIRHKQDPSTSPGLQNIKTPS